MTFFRFLKVFFSITCIALPSASLAAEMFLKIDGIEGEAVDAAHKDEINVLSWSWGATNSGSTHSGSGGGAGAPSFQDLSVLKFVDKSSAQLLLAVAKGSHFPDATLYIQDDTGTEYERIEMKEVLVTSLRQGGDINTEGRQTETITLNFAQFCVVTTTGAAATTGTTCWNIPTNVEI